VRGRNLRLLLAAFVASLIAACGGQDSDDTASGSADGGGTITIASNPTGTNVYAVAAAIAKLIQQESGRRATIRPFSGSSVYLPMLQRGEVALGLNTSIDSYLSFRGLPPYTTPMHNLRALGMMFPLNIAFMARADSGLASVADLRGQRVVVTFRANAALEQLHRGILATGGLTFDDIEAITVAGVPEAVTALQEGRADAVPIGLGTALALQAHAALPDGIRYLTLGADETLLAEIMPGTRIITVTPGPNQVGVPTPIRISSIPDMLNTGTHLGDDDAFALVRTLHTNWAVLRAELPQLLQQQAADQLAPTDNLHPYHPGAVRYFREAGLWTDAHEANQRALLELAATD
jgi:TRAP transporter TAXI family solute receptor